MKGTFTHFYPKSRRVNGFEEHYVITLGSFWCRRVTLDHFRITLGSLLGSLGTTLGSLWVYEGGFGPPLGYFGISLGVKGGLVNFNENPRRF